MARTISIDSFFRSLLPHFSLAVIEAEVENKATNEELSRELAQVTTQIASGATAENIKELPAISYTRNAYKVLGKDPNRYRPAAEQLRRRVMKGLGIYTINQLVDLGNLVSLATGFSIGVLDGDKVGKEVLLRVGTSEDIYEGIGRGILNVEGLPLYTDEHGPFASPTSDSERTKIDLSTRHTLIFINNYIPTKEGGEQCLDEAVAMTTRLLTHLVSAKNIHSWRISSQERSKCTLS